MNDLARKLRGALGNALVWGGAWFLGALVLFPTLVLLLDLPFELQLSNVLRGAANFGVTGAVVGGAFSAYLGLVYRGRNLGGISATLVAVGGGGLAALVSMAIGGTGFFPALLGAATAGGSLKLAQGAANKLGPGTAAQALSTATADPAVQGGP